MSQKRQRETITITTTVPKDKGAVRDNTTVTKEPAAKRVRTMNFCEGVRKHGDRHGEGGETQFFTWKSYAPFGDTTGDRQFFECTFVRDTGPYNKGETVDSIDHCASESLFKVYRTKEQSEQETPDRVFDIQLLVFERPQGEETSLPPAPTSEADDLFGPPHRESSEAVSERLGDGLCCLLEHGDARTEPHLRWVIDQTLRKLCADEYQYAGRIVNFETRWRKEGVKWDTGEKPDEDTDRDAPAETVDEECLCEAYRPSVAGGTPVAERVSKALDCITEWGGEDGAHHKQWVLNKLVRILTGKTESGYKHWTTAYGVDEDGKTEWDDGIAP